MALAGYIFITIGFSFILIAGVGILRMPSFLMRLQATSKASTVGVIAMVIGLNLLHPSWETAIKGSVICLFLLITAPVATHALALAMRRDDRS